jgi:drug/metabolite transporter (DMT)-like permease
MPFQIAALGAAFCWALGGLAAAEPARRLGGPRFTRLRMLLVAVIMTLLATLTAQWSSLPSSRLWLLVGSAVIGLAIGDAALFTGFARFGPRRTSVVFTTNAPMAAILGAVVFDEPWTGRGVVGTALIVTGVVLAVVFGTRGDQSHRWEQIVGSPYVAFSWALLGALCQASGAIMVKPIFEDGGETFAVAAGRVLIAIPVLWALARPLDAVAQSAEREALSARMWGRLFVSGLFGMVIGMTLLLQAINTGDVGVATVLSSTTPVMMLPLLWITTKERPAMGAWAGAALAVIGTTLLAT